MPKHFFQISAIGLTIAMIFLLQSCEEPEEIGKDLVPGQDNLNVEKVDSTTIHAFSYGEDSLQTSDPQVVLAGSYRDEKFGQTNASFYTQLRMTSTSLDFGVNPVADSIVLTIPYHSYYGDTTQSQQFEVFELAESLNNDSTYYSDEQTDIVQTPIGQQTITPKPRTSVVDNGDTLPPLMRIKLDHSLAERFINAGSSVFVDNKTFLNYFKGIYVKPVENTGDGSILSFNPYSSNANMTLYYHNNGQDSLSTSFYMSDLSAKYSYFEHDFTTGSNALQQQVVQEDTIAPIQSLFVQSMAGVNIKVRFPHFDDWKKKDIALNKATLVLKTDPNDNTADTYQEPPRLGMAKVTEDGNLELLTDFVVSSDVFDGYFHENRNEYRFVITRHMQEILNGEEDYGLIIVSDRRSSNAYRAVLNGPQAQNNPMQLELIYTKLD
ncbi:MAG: DUF4270 domain-containing protein [Bacteroidales bacterium]|nr:DUF4270 domain-containing protein [Bacteroidales bacterium]MCF8328248.1 DUF4270 domain-containing protein [Bacteroidales bacterium]